jgi:hypothetical protein
MSLTTLLEQIKVQQPFADEDVDSGPRETLPARRGRQSRAVETVKQLKEDYANELRRTVPFVVVIGSRRDDFVTLANKKHKCFSTDPATFYTDLVNRIPAALYLGKEGIPNMFDVLGRYLEDKMLEFVGQGVREYNQLIFKERYGRSIKSREDFQALVTQALLEQVGGEIIGIQAVHTLTNEAIKRDYTGGYFAPILLPTGDEKFGLTIATDLRKLKNVRVALVVAGETTPDPKGNGFACEFVVEDPTPENVKKALKTLSTKLNRGE